MGRLHVMPGVVYSSFSPRPFTSLGVCVYITALHTSFLVSLSVQEGGFFLSLEYDTGCYV